MQLAFQTGALAFSGGTRIYIIWKGRRYVAALGRLLQTSTWRQIWVNFSQSLQGRKQVARLQEQNITSADVRSGLETGVTL